MRVLVFALWVGALRWAGPPSKEYYQMPKSIFQNYFCIGTEEKV